MMKTAADAIVNPVSHGVRIIEHLADLMVGQLLNVAQKKG